MQVKRREKRKKIVGKHRFNMRILASIGREREKERRRGIGEIRLCRLHDIRQSEGRLV